jgi:hypothetical protein
MKNLRLAALVAVMTALPVIGFAQTSTASSRTAKAPKVVTTTVTGVVKSVDAGSMVIARSDAKGREETFQLTGTTTRKGTLASGDVVSVRYIEANGQKTATVVTVKSVPKKHGK